MTITESCFTSWTINEPEVLAANDAFTELLVRGRFEARYRK